MSGTSNSSPQSCSPLYASERMLAPVARITTDRTDHIAREDQTRTPYTSVRLIQTKWNGIVSQLGQAIIATQFAAAKTAHPASSGLRRSQPITRMSHGLDRCLGPELLPQSAHADLDDVRARVEVVAPHLGEQLLQRERLRHVVGGAELEPAELRLHVAARGEDHDRQLRLRALQLLQDLEPVQPGQQQVQHDEIPARTGRKVESFVSVAGRDD